MQGQIESALCNLPRKQALHKCKKNNYKDVYAQIKSALCIANYNRLRESAKLYICNMQVVNDENRNISNLKTL